MTYRCKLHQIIQAPDGLASGELEIHLPFVPYPGLALANFGIKRDPVLDGEPEAIKSVCYVRDAAGGFFEAELVEDNDPEPPLRERFALYGAGWRWEIRRKLSGG